MPLICSREHVARYFENRHLGDLEKGWEDEPCILNISIPDEYVEHGNVDVLRKELGIDSESITERIVTVMKEMEHKSIPK